MVLSYKSKPNSPIELNRQDGGDVASRWKPTFYEGEDGRWKRSKCSKLGHVSKTNIDGSSQQLFAGQRHQQLEETQVPHDPLLDQEYVQDSNVRFRVSHCLVHKWVCTFD